MWQWQTCVLWAQNFPKGVWNRHHGCGMYILFSPALIIKWSLPVSHLLFLVFKQNVSPGPYSAVVAAFSPTQKFLYVVDGLICPLSSPTQFFLWTHSSIRISAGPVMFSFSANQFGASRSWLSCRIQKWAFHNVHVCEDLGIADRSEELCPQTVMKCIIIS